MGHPGVVIRKFGEDQIKNPALPVGLFFAKFFPGCGYNSMPDKPPHLL